MIDLSSSSTARTVLGSAAITALVAGGGLFLYRYGALHRTTIEAEDSVPVRADDRDRTESDDSEPADEKSRRVRLNEVPQGPVKRDPVLGGSAESEQGGADESDRQLPEAGQLTAGRWRDLEHWTFWTDLFGQGEGEDAPHEWARWEGRWKIHTRRRFPVRVTTGDGAPAVDTPVRLRDADGTVVWRTRTDNRGRAELFDGLFGSPSSGPYTLTARSGPNRAETSIDHPTQDRRIELSLPDTEPPKRALDLMFVVDTTGSMGDELQYLQSELRDVVRRSRKYFGRDLAIRTSVNVYRDEGDSYLLRTHPFRSEVAKAVADLEAERAAGGGDYPEAVDRALAKSVRDHEWRDRATARLLFFVLDAPPHRESEVVARLHEGVRAAAKRGVRVVPVAASGIDKSTEFLLRSMAIATGGTYTFLTDDSGIGNSHIEPTIGDHEVHFLNDLLVTVVHDYTKPVGGAAGRPN